MAILLFVVLVAGFAVALGRSATPREARVRLWSATARDLLRDAVHGVHELDRLGRLRQEAFERSVRLPGDERRPQRHPLPRR